MNYQNGTTDRREEVLSLAEETFEDWLSSIRRQYWSAKDAEERAEALSQYRYTLRLILTARKMRKELCPNA